MIVQAESLSTTRCYILVATGPCGSLSIRDVLPLELFTCLWLVSPQAPAVERLFSLPSAMVQQFDFIKHFLISTPFSNWCSLCCARSNFCLVQDTKIVTQRPNSRTLGFLFSSSWWISLLVKKKQLLTCVWKFSEQGLHIIIYDRRILSHRWMLYKINKSVKRLNPVFSLVVPGGS